MQFGNEAGKKFELPIDYVCNKCGDDGHFQHELGMKCEKCGEGEIVAKMAMFSGVAIVDLNPELAKEIEAILKQNDEGNVSIDTVGDSLRKALSLCVKSNNGVSPALDKMGLSTLMSLFDYLNQLPTLQMENMQNGGVS